MIIATSNLTKRHTDKETDNMGDSIVWSSTTYVKTPSSAWLVNFYDGTAYTDAKSALHQVRAVRGGS